jgi:broad specificity phosphatase PhoE
MIPYDNPEPAIFWLIRHALVEENARALNYGIMDVELCPQALISQGTVYAALARRLPRGADWAVTPLSRTRRTAEAIFAAGYPAAPLEVVPGLIEQDMGAWQGRPHAEIPALLQQPAHAFWPLAGDEAPPAGESMAQVITRVGAALEELAPAHAGRDLVVVSHGGAIRAAVAHALGIGATAALHLSVQNLSLTCIERHARGWKVVCVNEMAGF